MGLHDLELTVTVHEYPNATGTYTLRGHRTRRLGVPAGAAEEDTAPASQNDFGWIAPTDPLTTSWPNSRAGPGRLGLPSTPFVGYHRPDKTHRERYAL